MASVSIFSVPTSQGGIGYVAVSDGKRSHGATAGQALDALTSQLGEREACTLVIVQDAKPDEFFTAEQQQRLAQLMTKWGARRDPGSQLADAEHAELDALVDAELRGAAARAAALADGLKR